VDVDASRIEEDTGGRQLVTGRDSVTGSAAAAGRRQRTTFPHTTASMIGWAQSLTPALDKVRPLERHARPVCDLRKTFGWPWDSGE